MIASGCYAFLCSFQIATSPDIRINIFKLSVSRQSFTARRSVWAMTMGDGRRLFRTSGWPSLLRARCRFGSSCGAKSGSNAERLSGFASGGFMRIVGA